MTNRGSSAKRLDVFEGAYLANDLLHSVITDLQVGILIQDSGTEILYCNRAAAELFGATEDEMTGKTLVDPQWDVLREDGGPFLPADHPAAQVIRTGQPSRNIVIGVRGSSRRVWLEVNAYPLFETDGGVSKVVCTLVEINARNAVLAESRRAAMRAQLVAILSGHGTSLQNILQLAIEALVVHLDVGHACLWIQDKDDGALKVQASA